LFIIDQSHVSDFSEGVKSAICLKVKLKAHSSVDGQAVGGHFIFLSINTSAASLH